MITAVDAYDLTTFKNLFIGNTSRMGRTVDVVFDSSEDKAKGKSTTINYYEEAWEDHLSGKAGMGLSPLLPNGNVRFSAIDIDSYDYDQAGLVRFIKENKLPLVPMYSKSKHLHIYIFYKEEVEATQSVNLLNKYKAIFLCHPKTEVFPKQTVITDKTKYPNWINLPYFGDTRQAISKDGTTPVPLSVFTRDIQPYLMSYNEHLKAYENFRYKNCRPCVLAGLINKHVQERNNWLFNCAAFLKDEFPDEDLTSTLNRYNRLLDNPLPENEVDNIIKEFDKVTYSYLCQRAGFECNKEICTNIRKLTNRPADNVNFGKLTQILTDPPIYRWMINEKPFTFNNEIDMMNQIKFRSLCLRNLNYLPYKMSDSQWTEVLNKALQNIEYESPDVSADFGWGTTVQVAIMEYFNIMAVAHSKDDVEFGMAYYDKEKKGFYFMAQGLMSFLRREKNIKDESASEVRTRVIDLGATLEGRYWFIPEHRIDLTLRNKLKKEQEQEQEQEQEGF